MKLEIHSLLHNEADILLYFIRHYAQYTEVGNIYFYESDSTDGSPEIAKYLGANVIDLPTNNEVNELVFLKMKNNCWKNSDADWVIICDTDEFVYHPNLLKILERTKYNAFRPKEWRMIAKKFPTTKGQIYDEVKYGFEGLKGYNKLNVFKPSEIKEIDYYAGCHAWKTNESIRLAPKTDIITLHFHDLGLKYRLQRNKYIANRVSDLNKKNEWGSHVFWSEKTIRNNFRQNWKKAVKLF